MKGGTKIAILMAMCFCMITMSIGGYYVYKSQPPPEAATKTAAKTAAKTESETETESESESDSDAAAATETETETEADAFLEGGTGKFNKHLPGYCLNWKKGDQNSGDISYGKKTVAECKRLCFDKGPDGSDELTACEWGKGDLESTTTEAACTGHTADINRFAASGHKDRMCWTTAAPADYDDTNEKLYGKM